MLFRRLKTVSFLIVLWLALLQAMAPLMHAHPHGAAGDGVSGVHMHADGDAQDTSQSSLKGHPVQTIGVDAGGSFSDDALLLPPLLLLFLLAAIGLPAMAGIRLRPACVSRPRPSPTRFSSSPRAPPFFG